MTAELAAPASSLLERVAGVVAETLRIPRALVTPDESFAALGMDSLAAVELTAALEDELGREVPLAAVHEFPTLQSLCAFIEYGGTAADVSSRDRMLADAVLPLDIRPDVELRSRARLTREARSVLVTGATGFVGAFLLRALADETSTEIHCLVRQRGGDGRRRLRDHLARYGVWSSELDARIHLVEGDITLARFGLSTTAFAGLTAGVDAVYHAAADVNWVTGYDALRSTNVLGTVEVLRFACSGVPKPVHFLSSISTCHSTRAPRAVNETLDTLSSIDGLWMGYAQTKSVAEAVVREAGTRGLPVTIIRPSLVTGSRRDGRSNPDDLVSRFIAGCVRMRAAPDLDWRMDCVPVDEVATSIVRLSLSHEKGIATSHLGAIAPRHWRECVLWMRLAGYEIDLVPYRQWMQMLRATPADSNPLHPLRAFFLHPILEEHHLTLPELLEETRRTQVSDAITRAALNTLGQSSEALDTRLLSRYFDDFERHALVPRIAARPRTGPGDQAQVPSLVSVLPALAHSLSERYEDDIAIESVSLHRVATNDSIIAELTSWRGGTTAGLYHADVEIVGRRGGRRAIRLFVKSKAKDTHVIEVAECVASLASPLLGETVSRFRNHLGFTGSHAREVALYADLDARLRTNTPRVFATQHDDDGQQWLVVLESIDTREDGKVGDWSDEAIEAAIVGLAQIHAVGFERRDELATASWQAPPRDAGQRDAMAPLWSALAEHAFEQSPSWTSQELRRTHARILERLGEWSRALDGGATTLIHNDFNARNIAMRCTERGLKLCAFDWELATIALPQRDLAELLAFVLPADASRATVARWIERHRTLLERETGVTLRSSEWELGFSAVLCDVLVDRLASYAMVDRIRTQSFLPRVVRGWNNLFHHFPWTG